MSSLTPNELSRYQRHLSLKGFGLEGQTKLKGSKVLIVGVGGLGCPAAMYLAAAGVGKIGIADHDVISITNLQRQILYQESQIGKSKAQETVTRLRSLNSQVEYETITSKLTSTNALEIISKYDVIVDATDNFPARYLLNDACVLCGKPLVHASILQFEGHLAVFNFEYQTGNRSANYRDLFPVAPAPDSVPDCSEAGVLGALPGILGSMQALEVMKIITGFAEPLADKLLIWDSLEMSTTIISIKNHNSSVHIKSLIDYEDFCGISQGKNKSLKPNESTMKEVTVQELQKMKESGEDFQLIDVREPYEYDICNLDGELIPMSEIPNNVERIAKNKKVVIHCRSGKRSGDMLLWLEKNHNLPNLYNLKGGILAWAKEIDEEMPTY
jgi:sulfur-carrier protein adenylyltransferase/sulfurtransferase